MLNPLQVPVPRTPGIDSGFSQNRRKEYLNTPLFLKTSKNNLSKVYVLLGNKTLKSGNSDTS